MRARFLLSRLHVLCFPVLFASAPALAVDHPVSVGSGGFNYSPQTVNANVGDTITFTNAGGFHNVATDPGAAQSFRCANGCDGAGGNGNLSGSLWSATVTLTTVGTIGYHCEQHGTPGNGMFGTIIVATPVRLQKFDVE